MRASDIIKNPQSVNWADRYDSADAAQIVIRGATSCDGIGGSPSQEDVVVFLGDVVALGAGRRFKDVFYKDPSVTDKWGDPQRHPIRQQIDACSHPDMNDTEWNRLLDQMTWTYIRSGNVDIYHGQKQKRAPQECRDYVANEASRWREAEVFPITDGLEVIRRSDELDWSDPYLSWVAVQSAIDAIGKCDGQYGRPDAFDVLMFFGEGAALGYAEALANKLFKANRPFREEAPFKEYFLRNKPDYFTGIEWSKWCNACFNAYRKCGAYDDLTYSREEMDSYKADEAKRWSEGLDMPDRG